MIRFGLVTDMLDVLACAFGIWALNRLFKPHCTEHEPECSCQAKLLIDTMKGIIHDPF